MEALVWLNLEKLGEIKMFETKELIPDKRKKRFYNILMGYWIIVPVIYFASFFLFNAGSGQSYEELLSENLGVILNILKLSINLILAYVLYATAIPERKKGGVTDTVLKLAIPQQLLTGNIVGAIFSFLAFNELTDNPLLTEEEEKAKKPIKTENKKSIIILLVVLNVVSLGVAYVSWRMN
ncbi:hypothetical protein JTF06_06025 [Desemzia sp. RIT804]|uniref:hypothetical protein n=1 Tax=Desemzia sp. RIT 804 TaxID=2810209 RepID=UPI00194F310C|nr:hypothetical protein [Desemzia sp. RIT 804]MBM6614445.1 hypothetical protein [Desemzia sp. RIT 804]